MKVILRQADITFSKDFVDVNRENGILLSRKNLFSVNAICINHGNSHPIKLKPTASKFYLLNKPESIRTCSNKIDNWKLLPKFYPKTYQHPEDVRKFPVIVKPIYGHHGYGIKIFKDKPRFLEFMRHGSSGYIIQDCIDIQNEYRFNIIDRTIFQISRKIRLDEQFTPKGGFEFSYKSLGVNADLSNKFRTFIEDIITEFHRKVGNDMADYCIDIIKGKDGNYYLTEMNSAYGLGQFTIEKLINEIRDKYEDGVLEKYRVR
jgi:glutathione synthase/RimK-type ligase-like ATP-grasp enzyme